MIFRTNDRKLVDPCRISCLLRPPWKFKIATTTNSNTKMSNYKFVLPSVRVRMAQLSTEQRVFVATTYTYTTYTQSLTEGKLDEGKL